MSQTPISPDGTYDYIIVGSGSAGSVLADRLSADGKSTVLVLEAGGGASSPLVHVPVGYYKLVGDRRYDWCYEQEADPSLGGRSLTWPAGKLLGGSSSINGQIYTRGTRDDFDRWAAAGCQGWDFDSCYPYFLKSEGFEGAPASGHGTEGPLGVAPLRDPHWLTSRFLEACDQSGIRALPDCVDGNMDGGFDALVTQKGGMRCSTARGYLAQARRRSNVTVTTHAEVQKIRFDGTRAAGVTVMVGGRLQEMSAAREVIVCAGAIGSPLLLKRSGIGSAEELRQHGIAVVADRAGVGENLQEHAACSVSKTVNVPTYNVQVGPLHMVGHALAYFFRRKGPFSSAAVQAMALARTNPDLELPDVQLHFQPLGLKAVKPGETPKGSRLATVPAITIHASICRPYSRGSVRLSQSDPLRKGRIFHQLLGDERDRATIVDGCKLIERIFAAEAFSPIVTGPLSPGEVPRNDVDWLAYAQQKTGVCYHPVGTCRMGSDENSVVDLELKARGVQGLRVVDASVFPSQISVNTNAATIMVAERISDQIVGRNHV